MKKKLAFINMQMEKGKFSQNTTRFKDKSRNVQPVIIDIELVNSLIGDETNKAPSVAAVNDALEGKVDKITDAYRAYTTNKDGELNPVKVVTSPTSGAIPIYFGTSLRTGTPLADGDAANKQYVDDGLSKKLDIRTDKGKWVYTTEEGVQAIRRVGTNPAAWNIPWFDGQGKLKSNDPVEDLDCVNKKTMDGGLAGRVSVYTDYPSKLYGTGGSTGAVTQRVYSMSPVGWTTGDVVSWRKVDADSFDYNTPVVCTIGVCDPIKPIQVANKRYVDGKVSELEHGMMNALGSQYITVEVKDFGASIPIPSGAMKFAYIESLGVIKGYDDDGNELGVAEVDAINVGDTEHSIDDLPKYIEIPEGIQAISLSVTPPVETVYTQGVGGKIVFQVKVGG